MPKFFSFYKFLRSLEIRIIITAEIISVIDSVIIDWLSMATSIFGRIPFSRSLNSFEFNIDMVLGFSVFFKNEYSLRVNFNAS